MLLDMEIVWKSNPNSEVFVKLRFYFGYKIDVLRYILRYEYGVTIQRYK